MSQRHHAVERGGLAGYFAAAGETADAAAGQRSRPGRMPGDVWQGVGMRFEDLPVPVHEAVTTAILWQGCADWLAGFITSAAAG